MEPETAVQIRPVPPPSHPLIPPCSTRTGKKSASLKRAYFFPAAGLYLSARLLRFSFRPFIRVNQAAGDVKKTMDFFRRVRPQRTNLCPCISAEHTDRHTTCSPYPVSGFPDGLKNKSRCETQMRNKKTKPNKSNTITASGTGFIHARAGEQMTKNLKGPKRSFREN